MAPLRPSLSDVPGSARLRRVEDAVLSAQELQHQNKRMGDFAMTSPAEILRKACALIATPEKET
jgi:hypothetical protein